MAGNGSENTTIVPTAVDLSPQFPYPSGNASDRTQGSKLRPHATDGGASGNFSEREEESVDTPPTTVTPPSNVAHRQPAPQLSRFETDIACATRPPLPQKAATESLRPQNRQSFLGRKKPNSARNRLPQVKRQATLTFGDDFSDSSSSSDDDGEPTTKAHADGEALGGQRAKKARTGDDGPYSRFKFSNNEYQSKGKVKDGRLKLSINETMNSGYFAKTLGAGLKKHLTGGRDSIDSDRSRRIAQDAPVDKISPEEDIMEDPKTRVKLNVVIIVIGSRGDIQPFIKIGKILKEDYGHRVRLATHPAFRKFVEDDSGLEFFSVGGDPSELMAFMVKNPGLIPGIDTIKEGEIGKRRAAMYDMFQGMWRACINATDDEDDHHNLKMMGQRDPFVADAIIANPPSFAPPHIAERLGIPLHMMFTFPYSPTVQFPHPLANIKAGNVDANYTNFMSYPLVEMMTWQGLGDLINRFRAKTLWLDEVSTLWAPGQLYRLKVPYTYMWSPGLVPKPKDWGPEIDIAGFVFLDLASSFKPPDDLAKFLDDGEPPVYIGFGSIVVDDPDAFTKLIFEAVKIAGVRALVSKGWGGFGSNEDCPDNIFMLENTPHDWLFPRVSAVVHHGGAGTTAIGLKCGKPTMIVPFFGDQPFWGGMVSKAKAGAHDCIPYKKLTAERLAEGIKQCLTDEARKNVQQIADSIAKEGDGALNAVRSFHRSLPLRGENNMRCEIIPNRCAAWKLKNTNLRLSPLVADLLVLWKKLRWNDLRLIRHYEWNDFGGPGEPLTGVGGALLSTMEDVFTGVGLVPYKMAKSVKKREKYYEKKYRIKKRQKHKQETLARANAEHANGGSLPNGTTATDKNKTASQNKRPKGPERQETTLSTLSEPEDYLAEEFAKEAGHGFKKTGEAIIKSPMHISLAIAQGFHNAPRLYGDETVRRPPRITGFHSGLRAGRDEFVYGIHDGITGIWKQPVLGAKSGGVLGAMRGVGMGIGGLLLKDIAAFVGPPAYFMKGLNEESQKKYQPTSYLRRARIIQGSNELAEIGPRIPGRKGSSARTSGEVDGVKRQEIEMQVSRKWEGLQKKIAEEQKMHQTGIKAALLGKTQRKEGKWVDRKSLRHSEEHPDTNYVGHGIEDAKPKHSASAPINQAKRVDDPVKGIDRWNTAPDTSMAHKEKTKKKKKNKLEPIPHADREDAKNNSNRKQDIPNIFMTEDGVPTGEAAAISPTDEPRPLKDFDNRRRTTSNTMDWATIRREAELGEKSHAQAV